MKPQEREDGLSDHALGILEMDRLRPGDPTYYRRRRRPMIAVTAVENILQKITKGWNSSAITFLLP